MIIWTRNEQLGDGTVGMRSLFGNATGLASGVAGVACGFQHTTVLLTSGELVAFGFNGHGQLAVGDFDTRYSRYSSTRNATVPFTAPSPCGALFYAISRNMDACSCGDGQPGELVFRPDTGDANRGGIDGLACKPMTQVVTLSFIANGSFALFFKKQKHNGK